MTKVFLGWTDWFILKMYLLHWSVWTKLVVFSDRLATGQAWQEGINCYLSAGLMAEVDPNSDEVPERSRLEDIKYYTSLFLGSTAIICVFAFLFLIPFILDPDPWQAMSFCMGRLTVAGQAVARVVLLRYSSATRYGSPTHPRGTMRATPWWRR